MFYSRVNEICTRTNINIVKFIFDNKFKIVVKDGYYLILEVDKMYTLLVSFKSWIVMF